MTDREMLELAAKAGLVPDNTHPTPQTRHMRKKIEALLHFASLIAAAERKNIADRYDEQPHVEYFGKEIADDIRERCESWQPASVNDSVKIRGIFAG